MTNSRADERTLSPAEQPTTADSPDRPTGWRGALWWIGWPLRQLLLLVISAYRRWVSPMLAPRCRYHPSCSAYGLQAVQRHGAVKGFTLASWRLLRCNPLTGGGLDPVPDAGRWLPNVYPDGRVRPGHGGDAHEGWDSARSIGSPGPGTEA